MRRVCRILYKQVCCQSSIWSSNHIRGYARGSLCPTRIIKLLTPHQQIRPLLLHQQPQALARGGVVVEASFIDRSSFDEAITPHVGAAAGTSEGDEVLPRDGIGQGLGVSEAQIKGGDRLGGFPEAIACPGSNIQGTTGRKED